MAELLSTLALATKELKQGRSSEFLSLNCFPILTQRNTVKLVSKLFGGKDVDTVLQRLDRLTQDEARTTVAQTLEVVHRLVWNMSVVMDGEQLESTCNQRSFEHLSPRRQSFC